MLGLGSIFQEARHHKVRLANRSSPRMPSPRMPIKAESIPQIKILLATNIYVYVCMGIYIYIYQFVQLLSSI